VALARAVVAEPPLLLADEPTGNLDRGTGAQVMDLLFGLRERLGTTLLLITHDQALAERCPHRLQLEDGRIVADTGPGQMNAAAAGRLSIRSIGE
jgi:putative ABC transport system ATP-binding protein